MTEPRVKHEWQFSGSVTKKNKEQLVMAFPNLEWRAHPGYTWSNTQDSLIAVKWVQDALARAGVTEYTLKHRTITTTESEWEDWQ